MQEESSRLFEDSRIYSINQGITIKIINLAFFIHTCMTTAQARFIQANPSLFSAVRQAEANEVAGQRKSLRRIFQTKAVRKVQK